MAAGSLAQEVAGFGVKVTLIEPGAYSTDWGGSSARHAAALPAYDTVREQAAVRPSRRGTAGEPVATRDAVLTLVESADLPLRVFFGEAPLAIATADYESRLATWNDCSPCPSPRTAARTQRHGIRAIIFRPSTLCIRPPRASPLTHKE